MGTRLHVPTSPHQNYLLPSLRQGQPISLDGKASIVEGSVFVFHCVLKASKHSNFVTLIWALRLKLSYQAHTPKMLA